MTQTGSLPCALSVPLYFGGDECQAPGKCFPGFTCFGSHLSLRKFIVVMPIALVRKPRLMFTYMADAAGVAEGAKPRSSAIQRFPASF